MISTVTVSTITTITSIAALGIGVGISIFMIVFLIGLLTARELAGASESGRAKIISRCINISIIPMVLSFGIIVALKVMEILG